jgi:hypothetical protein
MRALASLIYYISKKLFMSLCPFYRATVRLGLLTVRRAATSTVDLGGLWLTGPTGAPDVPRSHVFHWALLGEWGLWQPVIFGGLLTMRSSYRTEDDSPMWMWREGRFVSRSPRDLAPGWGSFARNRSTSWSTTTTSSWFRPPLLPSLPAMTATTHDGRRDLVSYVYATSSDSDRGKHVIYYRIL